MQPKLPINFDFNFTYTPIRSSSRGAMGMGLDQDSVLHALLMVSACALGALYIGLAMPAARPARKEAPDDEQFRPARVVVVGAGAAGLACAKVLHEGGVEVTVLESSDGIGGRVRTDSYKGFLLDRGFQVFITAYPEVQRLINLKELKLCPFLPGSLVQLRGRRHELMDPFRMPARAMKGIFSPVGTFLDKIKVGVLALTLQSRSIASIIQSNPMTTEAYLSEVWRFSPVMIGTFFRPFFGGIFLSGLDQQSSTMFSFVFKVGPERHFHTLICSNAHMLKRSYAHTLICSYAHTQYRCSAKATLLCLWVALVLP
jgi:hypothetical protein